MSDNEEQSYYEILEIDANASEEEIHKAFLKAKTTYSPSNPALYSIFTEEEAQAFLTLIDEAYAVLGNSDRRRVYDEKLKNGTVERRETKKQTESTISSRPASFTKDEAIEEEIKSQDCFDGSFLQKIREYKKISVEEMCHITRIGRNYVEAIESNNFHSLPAPVFVRGFIVQISKTLGLEHKKVADSYMGLFNSSRES
ncbi:MAG: helix-turn-helix domain-containing protein [Bdellovibrionales bacterium]|nr:helix-turn-helix domain-containing protein [Bdellovibrionales bacterium]